MIVLAGIAVMAALATAPAHAGQAVTFQNDVAHRGFADEPALEPPLREIWSWRFWEENARRRSFTHPLIADGKVFTTSGIPGSWYGAGLYAFDAGTGELLWWRQLGPEGAWGDAAYMDGRVFAAEDTGLLQAFDADTGARLWQTQLMSAWAPPVADNGMIYITDGWGPGGRLTAIRASDGKSVWTVDVPGIRSAPALSATRAFVVYSCDTVLGVDRGTGKVVWKNTDHDCVGDDGKTPALYDGHVYTSVNGVGPGTGKVLNAATGDLVRRYPYGAIPAFKGTIGVFAEFEYPWGFGPHTLHARRLDSGATLWRATGDGSFTSPPLIVNDKVYVGSNEGNVFAYDLQTGRQVWSVDAGEGVAPVDEHNGSSGLSGLSAGEGLLMVPAGERLVAYAGPGWKPPPKQSAPLTPKPAAPEEQSLPGSQPPSGHLPGSEAPSAVQRVCTLVKCSSGIHVLTRSVRKKLHGARTVTVCLGERCSKRSRRSDVVRVADSAVSGAGPYKVRVVVRGRRGRVLLRVVRNVSLRILQPNGEACPPTCWHRTLRLDPRARTLKVITE